MRRPTSRTGSLAWSLASLSAALLTAPACRPSTDANFALPVPPRVARALELFSELSASAVLVPSGGAPGPATRLARGDDGASFSGFLAAEPGDYTTEVVFTGVVGTSTPSFLGRLVSDAFTVARGQAVSASFSRPLDPIGRPEDHGDDDGDGLGLIDELLFGADPARADSDGDGLGDGEDCDPTSPARAFRVVGTIEDCDGDGVARPDLPYPGGGADCNDRDARFRPGLEDDCGDDLDSDCNPATCPVSDETRPQISDIAPVADARLGCHARISATIRDNSRVTGAFVYFVDDPLPSSDRVLVMMRGDGERFASAELSQASGIAFTRRGPQNIEIRAIDDSGNTGTRTQRVDLQLAVPTVDLQPRTLGAQAGPFEVEVTASSPNGIAEIVLFSAPRSAPNGGYERAREVELGRATSSPARFSVDPARHPEEEQVLYAVVTDTVGNRLAPFATFYDPAGMGTTTADYLCLGAPYPEVPIRSFVRSGGSFTARTMSELLPTALQRARARDPNADLVLVLGSGVDASGRVALADNQNFLKRWVFGFRNATTRTAFSVTWYSTAYGFGENPRVDDAAHDAPPIQEPAALADSDDVAAAFGASPGCSGFAGRDEDSVAYSHNASLGRDVVFAQSPEDSWTAEAAAPTTVISACN